MPRVLLQKGHWPPREPGFEGGTGASGEQEVVGVLVDRLFPLLSADPRFSARVIHGAIPADIKSGADKVDAFISFHCDGSRDLNRAGWGVGYPDATVNRTLARLIAEEFTRIPHRSARIRDNYTRDMSGYYGWTRVPTSGPEVLVEHGFSSNPAEKRWMLNNAHKIAQAHYRALLRFFDLPAKPEPEEAEVTREELAVLEDFAKTYTATGKGPGPLAESKREVFWALVRARRDAASAGGLAEVAALRAKIAAAKFALE